MKKAWVIAAATFLAFAAAAGFASKLVHVGPREAWVLRIALLVLGLLCGAVVFVYLARRAKSRPAAPDDEIDAAVGAAQQRLAAAAHAKLGRLPVFLVLGPTGSTKTTLVTRSGLEPELLAGQVSQGDAVVPTAAVNIWYSGGKVLVEAGGGLLDQPERWGRLARRVQPDRLPALFKKEALAPRVAVVCFPCDEFLKPGASESVPAAAKKLRARLVELSQALGIRLPVYVVFSRIDRLPHWDEYVQNLSREEAQEVLGATLPAPPAGGAAAYAEREAARLGDAFRDLYRSLALRRLALLPRDAREDARAGAYEFPREFRKISDLAVQFLVEVCRPSQLSVSPFLRGFYFTGVRAIVVTDAALPQAPRPAAPGPALNVAATSVFDPRQLQAAAAAAAASRGSRRVPEWVFLPGIFQRVVLQDEGAMAVTRGGTRVNLLRRTLLGAAAAASIVLALGFTVAYKNNHDLERGALAAARGVEVVGAVEEGAAPLDALGRLEAVRAELARLRGYERAGHPWRLGFGLYSGDALLAPLRRLYFDRFERVLWGQTRERMLGFLRALPPQPNGAQQYDVVYDALKAHVVTTSEWARSTPEFLTPVLMRYWPPAAATNAEGMDLARRQFDFFGSELAFGNPYAQEADAQLVASTRVFLSRFEGVDQFYTSMIGAAGQRVPPVQFNRLFPASASVVRDAYEVPGAFTRQGWELVQADLKNVDRLFAREKWVVGERALSAEDRVRLAQQLRERYLADYVRHWQAYMRAAAVVGYNGVGDAALKLGQLAGNQSPLLQLLALASTNTAVDTAVVGKVFQPVHVVVPPGTDKYVVESNAPYVKALGGLQSALQTAATMQGPQRAMALSQASTSANDVNAAIQQVTQGFQVGGEAAAVGDVVRRLLQAPLRLSLGIISGLPAEEANAKGAALCQQFGGVTTKFPFNPAASAEASMDEVTQVFGRPNGAIWTVPQQALQGLIVQQGSGFAAAPGAVPTPGPAFLGFLNRAAAVSRALFDETGAGPGVDFTLRPELSADLPEITVQIDGQTHTFTRTAPGSKPFRWEGARARDARITARIGGTDVALLQAPAGPWALFRLFHLADWTRGAGGHYTVRWHVANPAVTVTADVAFAGGAPPIFMRDYLGGNLRCVSQVTR